MRVAWLDARDDCVRRGSDHVRSNDSRLGNGCLANSAECRGRVACSKQPAFCCTTADSRSNFLRSRPVWAALESRGRRLLALSKVGPALRGGDGGLQSHWGTHLGQSRGPVAAWDVTPNRGCCMIADLLGGLPPLPTHDNRRPQSSRDRISCRAICIHLATQVWKCCWLGEGVRCHVTCRDDNTPFCFHFLVVGPFFRGLGSASELLQVVVAIKSCRHLTGLTVVRAAALQLLHWTRCWCRPCQRTDWSRISLWDQRSWSWVLTARFRLAPATNGRPAHSRPQFVWV